MSAPTIIAFCAPVDRDRIIEALFGRSFFFAEDPIDLRGDSLILLAVGPDGGAALARWIAEQGLDGVAGVALVGVTAPWGVSSTTVPDSGSTTRVHKHQVESRSQER